MEIAVAQHAAGNVRAELARRRMTQQHLAADLGRSQAWLSRRLTGSVDLTIADLEAIAGALDMSMSRLLAAAA